MEAGKSSKEVTTVIIQARANYHLDLSGDRVGSEKEWDCRMQTRQALLMDQKWGVKVQYDSNVLYPRTC